MAQFTLLLYPYFDASGRAQVAPRQRPPSCPFMLQLRSVLVPRRSLAAAALLMSAVACGGGGGDGTTGPKAGSTTVAVTVPTQINVASNAGALTVQVAATYDRASGGPGALAAQTVTVSAPGSQSVPFTLDLAPCLNDAARAGGASATTCSVRLQLTLLAGGVAVDAQSVGAYTLAGGSTFTVTPAVTFTQVASVQVAPSAGNTARVALGGSLALTAQVLDPSGNALAGRAVRWSSSAPGVAAVDSLTGAVTPVAVGGATITATVAGKPGTLAVTVFTANKLTLAVAGGTGSGTVSSPSGIGCRISGGAATGTCSGTFPSDSVVTLTATPDAGTTFGGWGDGACKSAGTAATCTVTSTTAATASVTFLSAHDRASTLTLTLTDAAGSGGGSVALAATGGSADGTACVLPAGQGSITCARSVDYGANVTVTATRANPSTQTVTYSGACTGAGACAIPSVTANQTLGVSFGPAVSLTVATADASGSGGGGYVTSAPAGGSGAISCHRIGGQTLGATCSTQYPAGTQVTLTATPDPLSTFAGWSGACTSSGPTCTVTLGSAAVAPVANFVAASSVYGVSVAPVGTGAGSLTITTTIVSAPCTRDQANRADGGTCVAPWDPRYVPATIVITASPASGSRFTGWIGCPTGGASGSTCTVPNNRVSAVAASFDP